MVEIMNSTNIRENVKLPKNFRQIGLPEEKRKIYVEDYVVTYMNQLAFTSANVQSAAILLGHYNQQQDVCFTFVHGAIAVPSAIVEDDRISFNSEVWEEIYNTIRKYFKEIEIVGWFLTRPGKSLGVNEKITKIHVDYFPGKEKTLFIMDPMDKEEAFFIYENGKLTRQRGYYIYYDRNEEMQNYMVERKNSPHVEVHTDDLKRPVLTEAIEMKKRRRNPLSVIGGLAVVVGAIALGMIVTNRYLDQNTQPISNTHVVEETFYIQTEKETEIQPAMLSDQNATKQYIVRKGDTLMNLSLSLYDDREYVDVICEMNNIDDPNMIYEGMVLELP